LLTNFRRAQPGQRPLDGGDAPDADAALLQFLPHAHAGHRRGALSQEGEAIAVALRQVVEAVARSGGRDDHHHRPAVRRGRTGCGVRHVLAGVQILDGLEGVGGRE